MSVVGWYQISGQPTEAQQIPYLASATIPGAALIVAGAVMIAVRRITGTPTRGGPLPSADTRGAARDFASAEHGLGDDARLWAIPECTYVHRADCPLIDGKAAIFEVTAQAQAAGRPARRDGRTPLSAAREAG
jgi:hypothetical protein